MGSMPSASEREFLLFGSLAAAAAFTARGAAALQYVCPHSQAMVPHYSNKSYAAKHAQRAGQQRQPSPPPARQSATELRISRRAVSGTASERESASEPPPASVASAHSDGSGGTSALGGAALPDGAAVLVAYHRGGRARMSSGQSGTPAVAPLSRLDRLDRLVSGDQAPPFELGDDGDGGGYGSGGGGGDSDALELPEGFDLYAPDEAAGTEESSGAGEDAGGGPDASSLPAPPTPQSWPAPPSPGVNLSPQPFRPPHAAPPSRASGGGAAGGTPGYASRRAVLSSSSLEGGSGRGSRCSSAAGSSAAAVPSYVRSCGLFTPPSVNETLFTGADVHALLRPGSERGGGGGGRADRRGVAPRRRSPRQLLDAAARAASLAGASGRGGWAEGSGCRLRLGCCSGKRRAWR